MNRDILEFVVYFSGAMSLSGALGMAAGRSMHTYARRLMRGRVLTARLKELEQR